MSRTVRAALVAARRALAAAGVDDPARDARALTAAALAVDPARLTLIEQDRMTPDQDALLGAYLAMRTRRQPVAQIIGRRRFWRHEFEVTRGTLDPRPETETLVEAALARPFASVLDLGTGTGAILVSLLADRPGARGLGVDISPVALAVARGNADRIGVAADFALSDWFSAVEGRFDLIVSNPPYIAAAEMAGLAPEVRDWEPAEALTDGGDGLGAYRVIAAGARAHLAPGGAVMCEIGHRQGADVSALFAAAGAQVDVIPDLDGRDRVVSALFPA